MRMFKASIIPLLVLLAGCDRDPAPVAGSPSTVADGSSSASADGGTVPLELPPSILASKSLRCSDNSLAIIDFYSDMRSASVRTAKDGPAVRLVSPEAGGVMTADGGWSLKGGARDATVIFSSPARPKPMSCHP